MTKDKANDKIILAAAGYIDFSKDSLALKAAGVDNDLVEVLPASVKTFLAKNGGAKKNNGENLAGNANLALHSHVAYDPNMHYRSDSFHLSNIAWGRAGLVCAGIVVGTWTFVKVSKLAFNGVAEMLKAGRRNNGQRPEKKPVNNSVSKRIL